MCVIFVAQKKRPDEEMIWQGFQSNDAGAGVAWRETPTKGKEKGETIVRFEKGLDLKEVQDIAKKIPMPFVLHFRIPSCGGKRPQLCHPFPVEKEAPLDLSGTTKGYVLFHNGHWGPWKHTLVDAVNKSSQGWQVPVGAWSDTRAMAWYAAHFGLGILEFVDEKVICFGPKDIHIFKPEAWSIHEDIIVSNMGFLTKWNRTGHHHNDRAVNPPYHTSAPHSLAGGGGNVHSSFPDRDLRGATDTGKTESTVAPEPVLASDAKGVIVHANREPGGALTGNPFQPIEDLHKEGKLSRKQYRRVQFAFAKGRPFKILVAADGKHHVHVAEKHKKKGWRK